MEMPDHWIRWRSPKISSRYWTDSALGRRLRPITCGIVGCYRVPTSATISSIDSPAWVDRFRRAGASWPTSDSTTPVSGRHTQMTSPGVGCGTPAGHQGDGTISCRDAHSVFLPDWKAISARRATVGPYSTGSTAMPIGFRSTAPAHTQSASDGNRDRSGAGAPAHRGRGRFRTDRPPAPPAFRARNPAIAGPPSRSCPHCPSEPAGRPSRRRSRRAGGESRNPAEDRSARRRPSSRPGLAAATARHPCRDLASGVPISSK